MAIKAKSFIHNDDKLIGTDGSTCCPYGNNQIFTLVVLDNS
jgi:hypothetical protein